MNNRRENGLPNTRQVPQIVKTSPPPLPALTDKYKYTYSYAGKKGVIDIAECYAISSNLSLTTIPFDKNNSNMVDKLIDDMIFNKNGKYQNEQSPGMTSYIIIGKDDNIIADTQFVTWNKYKNEDKATEKPTLLLKDIYKNKSNLSDVIIYGAYNKKWGIRCPGSEKYEGVIVNTYFVITREYKSDNGTIFNSNYSKLIKPVVSTDVDFLNLNFKVQILGCVLNNDKIIPDMSYFEWKIDETDFNELVQKIEKDKEENINEEKILYNQQRYLEKKLNEEKEKATQNKENKLLEQNVLAAQIELDNNNRLREEAEREIQILKQAVDLLDNAINDEEILQEIYDLEQDIQKLEEQSQLELKKEKNIKAKDEIYKKYKKVLDELVVNKSTLEEKKEEINNNKKEIKGKVEKLLGTQLESQPPQAEAEPCKAYLTALIATKGGRRNKHTRKMKRMKRIKSRKIKKIKSRKMKKIKSRKMKSMEKMKRMKSRRRKF